MGLRLSGLASGLDSSVLIDALMRVERQPLLRSQQRKAEFEAERDLFSDFGTRLSALRDAAADLDNLSTGLTGPSATEEFLAYTASSSQEGVLTATASTSAALGSTSVVVESLAAGARHISTPFVSDTAIVAAAGDTLDVVGDAAPLFSITVSAPGATLNDLRDLINSDPANDGIVEASVLFDGSGHRLVLSGGVPGLVNDFSVSTTINPEAPSVDFIDPSLSVAASDAQLEVMGVAVTRPQNSIVDLIPGVSLELHAAAPGQTVEVSVGRDDEAITERVQTFVDAYNSVNDFVRDHTGYDVANQSAGALFGDSSIRGIELQLQRAVVSRVDLAGNPFGSLSEVGIKVSATGALELDQDALGEALATDASAVRGLFGGDGVGDGALIGVTRGLDSLLETDPVSGTKGLLELRKDGFEDRIDAVDTQILRLERRLEAREALLVRRFTEMERLVGQLQTQGGALSSLFVSS